MESKATYNTRWEIAPVFIWFGFLGAISLMEAWLKFRAPGVTLTIGLGIGQLVFGALNKVELVCCLASLMILGFNQRLLRKENVFLFLPAFMLLLQTVWLLPVLDKRAVAIIAGETVADSYLHIIYIVMEITKALMLLLYGIKALRNTVVIQLN